MKYSYLIILAFVLFSSCASKNQLHYINDSDLGDVYIFDHTNLNSKIEVGDILNIDVLTVVPEASAPYNNTANNNFTSQNFDILRIQGYLVNELKMINFPVLGEINIDELSIYQLEGLITQLLIEGNHLTDPTVKVKRINSKFTVLGEVVNPGTFSYFDENLNIFQALGYAGDLTINGKRKEITLIREERGLRTIHKIALTNSDLLKKPYYHIKNNDVIIVDPNFSKVKSSGFIGSTSSIASISSLLLSITLLILNK